MDLLKVVTAASLRKEPIGDFEVGDTVDVHTRIKEGDKERVQVFNGTVIARYKGHGEVNATFVVRRVVSGEGVERTFPVHSPKVVKVEVTRRGRVRRAKLFYLRDRVGKATKVREQLTAEEMAAEATTADAAKA
jgi:large subunit ribosomal protein L19